MLYRSSTVRPHGVRVDVGNLKYYYRGRWIFQKPVDPCNIMFDDGLNVDYCKGPRPEGSRGPPRNIGQRLTW
eukprot:3345737-Pyramimonas_sp.AAC.2